MVKRPKRLNEKADSYEQRAEKYESRGEKYNGHKERMEKEAGDLNTRSESIREKYDKKGTYTRDELIAEQIRNGSPTTGVDAEVMNDLFGRTLSYDFIEQPVEETVSYDPQINEATPGTTTSANQQNYTKIAIDSLEIEPLAHLDYPATGIDPGFQPSTAPAPEPLDPTTITMPAEEGFNFQQVTASTLEPVQITVTPPEIEEIPGLPQGAVIIDTANPEIPLPSDVNATDGYYQIPAFSEYQETGNFFTDMANLHYNKVSRAFNTEVDILNVPIHDAQYIGEHGWRAYGEAALEANVNGFKQLGYSLMEKVQTGMNLLRKAPGQVMDFFVFKEPGEILTDSYNYCKKSLTSVDAWDQAIDMMLGAVISKKFSGPSAMNNVEVVDDIAARAIPKRLTSRIKENSTLVKQAQYAGKSNQSGNDHLMNELSKGNIKPGIGNKPIGKGITESRGRDGSRIYWRETKDSIEILGKSTKAKQQKVIDEVLNTFYI